MGPTSASRGQGSAQQQCCTLDSYFSHPVEVLSTLTCFSTLTTRPIMLISSTASVSEGPLSPFSLDLRSPGPRPTIWSTLWRERNYQRD